MGGLGARGVIVGLSGSNSGGLYVKDGESFTAQIDATQKGHKLLFHPFIPEKKAVKVTSISSSGLKSQNKESLHQVSPIKIKDEMSTQLTGEKEKKGDTKNSITDDHRDMTLLYQCLEAQQLDASDLFFSTGSKAYFRLGRNRIVESSGSIIEESQVLDTFLPFLEEKQQLELKTSGSVDFAFSFDTDEFSLSRFRVNLFQTSRGIAAALRPIKRRIPTLPELNLPENFYKLTNFLSGLVLVTGSAGSGKSTTLASMVEHVNKTRLRHIVTLEDPIEFQYENKMSLIHKRAVGQHVESFSTGLRAALRESPDVILLGEMRDFSTISAALTAAETGHLVLSTLHCSNAQMAIDRIIDVFPGHQQIQIRSQLSPVLRAVISQHLLPSLQSGIMVPAYEKLIVNDAVACLIRESRGSQITTQIQTGRDEGMVSFERSLAFLVNSSKITLETALSVSRDKEGLRQLIHKD